MLGWLPAAGFDTTLVLDAARGITPEGIEAEKKQWAEVGVKVVNAADLLSA